MILLEKKPLVVLVCRKKNKCGVILLKDGEILHSYKVFDEEYTYCGMDSELVLALIEEDAIIEIFS